jgi:hypothetical protein
VHYVTAPGSVRGAVDFIHIGQSYYNVADFFIVGATSVFLLALGCVGWRAVNGPASIGPVTRARRPRRRLPAAMSALAGVVCLVVVVALGAANYGGVTAPPGSAVAPVAP